MRSINTHRAATGRAGAWYRTTTAVAVTLVLVAVAPGGTALASPGEPPAEDGSGVRSFHPSEWAGPVDSAGSNPAPSVAGGALESDGASAPELGIGAGLLALGGLTLLGGLVAKVRRRRPPTPGSFSRPLTPEHPARGAHVG